MTRKGKIARLPHALRTEVNTRLHNGQTGPVILKWLNSQPAAKKVWAEHFAGVAASEQNLSEWRTGGYREWLSRQERTEHLKTLSQFARDAANAGGNLADGAAAIIGGHILEALETAGNIAITGGSDDANKDPAAGLAKMAAAVATLQNSANAREKLALDKKRVSQKDKSLDIDREKLELQTCRAFIQWAKNPEIIAILDSGKPQSIQIPALREIMYGRRPSA
jgi:hypothetical protein